jgi:hypothetical protein
MAAAPVAPRRLDIALVIAVDASASVSPERWRLQMEGIARALEDPNFEQVVTGGPSGGIALSMIAWSDTAKEVLPWTIVTGRAGAIGFAHQVRGIVQPQGEFTCLGRMLRTVRTGLFMHLPLPADRIVVDVSGDGIDNCAATRHTERERDLIVDAGGTINGLPILVPGENDLVGTGAYRAPGFDWTDTRSEPHAVTGTTLDNWFRLHVIGGPAAFLVPARGYEDFERAFRRKFVTEVSGLHP